jgi:transcriptional regulator with XRE-family HTH domain
MLTPRLVRTARALLGWDQPTLASKSGLSVPTIQRIEAADDDEAPPGTARTAASIQAAFERAGVEFTNGDAPGVRLRKKN